MDRIAHHERARYGYQLRDEFPNVYIATEHPGNNVRQRQYNRDQRELYDTNEEVRGMRTPSRVIRPRIADELPDPDRRGYGYRERKAQIDKGRERERDDVRVERDRAQ